jgi:hypothetical protein
VAELVNPAFGIGSAAAGQLVTTNIDRAEPLGPVCSLSNGKQNADALLSQIARETWAGEPVHAARKMSPAAPAPQELIGALAEQYRSAVVGLGD